MRYTNYITEIRGSSNCVCGRSYFEVRVELTGTRKKHLGVDGVELSVRCPGCNRERRAVVKIDRI